MMAVKTPTSLASIARSCATAGIITPSDRTESEIITWMASMLATGTNACFTPPPPSYGGGREGESNAKTSDPFRSSASGGAFPLLYPPPYDGGGGLHPEQVCLVQDGVAQDADRGDVDHDAVDVDRAQTLGLGFGIGLLELAGARHVLGLGRVDLERVLDLRGMDRPLADAAQDHRAAAFLAINVGVLEVGEWAVDRVDAGGAAGHHQPEAGVV